MEIKWKVKWTCCLLTVLFVCLVSSVSSNPTPAPVPSVEPTAESEKEEDKPKSDLDTETQDQVAILKQINRVNEDGSYTFGYEAADGSFKIETRDVAGNVKGMFGFINEDGELKRISYSASNGTGFQSSGNSNIPPLPGTTLASQDEPFANYRKIPTKLYQQIIRPTAKNAEESSTRIDLLQPSSIKIESTTPEITTTRFPIYIYATTARNPSSSERPVVIQHIPKVRPTPASSSTEPSDSEEVTRKPVFGNYISRKPFIPIQDTTGYNEISSTTESTTRKSGTVQLIRPRTGPYKKIIVTKRPLDATTPKVVTTTDYYSNDYLQKVKENELLGNGVRRQLGYGGNYVTGPEFPGLITSGTEDSPDVYGGGPTARPYPANAYKMLFTAIPQHQRILQNSYIQNQNQYLAAAYGSALPPSGIGPQIQNQIQPQPDSTPLTTANPQNIPPLPDGRINPVTPGLQPGQRQPGIAPNPIAPPPQYFGPGYGNPGAQNAPLPPQANQDQFYNPQLYIPPALMEQIIRMLLFALQRRQQPPVSPFQQAVLATLGPGNIPPELQDMRYDPRQQQQQPLPYPNYSQVPPYNYPLGLPYNPRPNYDPRYSDPRYSDPRYAQPYPLPYPGMPYPGDPRFGGANYGNSPLSPPIPFGGPYQPRVPPGIDPGYQQQNDEAFLLRMLLGARYPGVRDPSPQVQTSQNTVVRSSPPYGQRLSDSTTSSATSKKTRFGSVRNVEILDPINEDNISSATSPSRVKSEKSS